MQEVARALEPQVVLAGLLAVVQIYLEQVVELAARDGGARLPAAEALVANSTSLVRHGSRREYMKRTCISHNLW